MNYIYFLVIVQFIFGCSVNVEDSIIEKDAEENMLWNHRMIKRNWINYKTITFDILNLISEFNPPPQGYTFDNAYIDGLDIYSATRGADIQFWLTDIQLNGTPK